MRKGLRENGIALANTPGDNGHVADVPPPPEQVPAALGSILAALQTIDVYKRQQYSHGQREIQSSRICLSGG